MKRRDFIRDIALGGAALQFAPSLLGGAQAQAKAPAGAGFPDLGLGLGESPKAITKAAVEAVGGMKRFVGRGDVVIVKPNIGDGSIGIPVAAVVRNVAELRQRVRLFEHGETIPAVAHRGLRRATEQRRPQVRRAAFDAPTEKQRLILGRRRGNCG